MERIIVALLVTLGIVFEDSSKSFNNFPVCPNSTLIGNSEFVANGEKAQITVFESKDTQKNIKDNVISSLSKNGWGLNKNTASSLSFSKGNNVIKVQIVENKKNNKTTVIYYKSKLNNTVSAKPNLDVSGEDFSDIPRYPGSRRALFIKRLTGSPHSTTISYETLDDLGSVISFYRNNMNKWKHTKLDMNSKDNVLYFDSMEAWCMVNISKSNKNTSIIIIKYEK
jgi:hypothetical protein